MRLPIPPVLVCSIAILVWWVQPAGLVAARVPAITDLGTLGGDESAAYGINNRGDVVGVSRLGIGQSAPVRAFLWTTTDGMQDLGAANGVLSVAYDVNDRRQVVGTYLVQSPETHSRAFLWSPGEGMMDLTAGVGQGINNRGQVVGSCTVTPNVLHACVIENGVVTDLGTLGGASSSAVAINERGVVVGTSETADGSYRAFWWTAKTGMVDLYPGDAWSQAQDITDAGIIAVDRPSGPALLVRDQFFQVLSSTTTGTVLGVNAPRLAVGASHTATGVLHAYAARAGHVVDLGTLGGGESIAFAVNNRGTIVGRSEMSTGEVRAVLWRYE